MSKFLVEKQHTLRGHRDCVYTLAAGAGPDTFYSAGGDGLVVRWDLRNPEQGKVVAKVPTSVYALCYDPDKNWLIVGQNYEGIHIIDLETGQERRSIKLGKAALFDIQQWGNHLLVATGDGEVLVIDYHSLVIRQRLQPSRQRARSMALNSATNELAVGFSDHTVRIYDANQCQLKQTLNGHNNSVFVAKYTPDGQFLVTAGRDAHLKIWDVQKNYQLTESIVAHMYAINYVDFNYDGQYFATGSMDKSVKVWDAHRFRLLKVIDKARHAGHGTSVNRTLWMPTVSEKEHILISGSDDRTISVWSLQETE